MHGTLGPDCHGLAIRYGDSCGGRRGRCCLYLPDRRLLCGRRDGCSSRRLTLRACVVVYDLPFALNLLKDERHRATLLRLLVAGAESDCVGRECESRRRTQRNDVDGAYADFEFALGAYELV